MTRMQTRAARRYLTALVVAAVAPLGAQRLGTTGRITQLPAPVLIDTTGQFQATAVRVGDDIYISGQPTERGLRALRAQGVTTVVNLRTPEEMNGPFHSTSRRSSRSWG